MEHVLNCTGYEMLAENIVKADGYYLYDDMGKRYMDFESGVWSIALGHCNKEFNQALKNQMDQILHLGFRYTSSLVEVAAKDVLETLQPFRGKCVFLCSGSEAVEFAVKAAKHIINGKKLLTFDLSYLSAYGQSGTKDSRDWCKLDLMKCTQCTIQDACSSCSVIEDIPFEEIGAFVFEPGNSSGLVLLPPKILVQEIEKRVKAAKGIVVVDEVTTGIGRTGKWYGFQHYDMKPDIVAMGKGIGNGYPVSVAAVDENIADRLAKDGFKHSQSHQNDGLGSAAASSVIQIIKENDLIEKADKNGQYLMQGLEKLKSRTGVIKEVRGVGLMLGIEFRAEAASVLNRAFDFLVEKGLLVGYNPRFHFMRFYPALTTSREDMDYLLSCLEEALQV